MRKWRGELTRKSQNWRGNGKIGGKLTRKWRGIGKWRGGAD